MFPNITRSNELSGPQYIFGGNTGHTPESIKRKRELAQMIMGQNPNPRNWGEGFAALANGIVSGVMNRRADEAEQAGIASGNATRDRIMAVLLGQPMPDGSVPALDAVNAVGGAGAPSDFMSSLVNSESGGNWNALNEFGYGGRLQFGDARLADAARAGIIPQGLTGAQFSQLSPEQQMAVESWHFEDIDRRAGEMSLDSYIGQNIGGVNITPDAIRAMAHLGGIGGAQRFIESGGQYNPSDAYGTSLSDYGQRHGGFGGAASSAQPVQVAQAGGSYDVPVDLLLEAISNPWVDDGTKAFANSILSQQMQRQFPQLTANQSDFLFAQQNPEFSGFLGRGGDSAPNFINVETPEGIRTFNLSDPAQVQQVETLFSTGQGRQVGIGAGDSAREGQIARIMEMGVDRNTAIGIADGVYRADRHPVTGELQVVDMSTGQAIYGGPGDACRATSPFPPRCSRWLVQCCGSGD